MNSVLKLGFDLALAVLSLHFSLTSCATVASRNEDDGGSYKITTEDPFPWFRWTWDPWIPPTSPPWKPDDFKWKDYKSTDDTSVKLAIFLPIVFVSLLIFACKWGFRNCSESSTYTSQSTVHAPPRQRLTTAAPPRQHPTTAAPPRQRQTPSDPLRQYQTFNATPGVHRNAPSTNQSQTTDQPCPRTLRMMMLARGNSQNENFSGGLRNYNDSRSNDNEFSPSDRPPDYSTVIINDMTDRSNFPEVRPEKTMDTPPPQYNENNFQRY